MKYYSSIRAFACHSGCRDAFRADRRAGLIYGLFRYENGKFALNREEASRNCFFCVYCNTPGKLEIEVNSSFTEVSPNIFRSWSGKRRIDGKNYSGPRYYFLTDEQV